MTKHSSGWREGDRAGWEGWREGDREQDGWGREGEEIGRVGGERMCVRDRKRGR